ncbi:MAG: hypothetical protein AAFY71_20360 [Bacteroidota bacterium]
MLLASLQLTDNQFTYPLDDTYIHLSIARSIQENGNWGPSSFQFQNSSSSPAFTALLSVAHGLGINSVYLPLFINVIAGLLWIWVISKMVFYSTHHVLRYGIFLGIIILLTPLPLLTLLGMEHILHLLMATLFLREASYKLEKPSTHPNGMLIITGILMCLFRYEGLFIILAFGVVGLANRNWRSIILPIAAACLALFLLGLFMLSQGGTILPISVLGKSQGTELVQGNISYWLWKAVSNLYDNPFMLILILCNLTIWIMQILKSGGILQFWIPIWLIGTLLHLMFAEVGGYRYEAYLIGLGLLVIPLYFLSESFIPVFTLQQKQIFVLLVAFLVFPLLIRSVFFSANYPVFCQNIYQQSVQVGKFLERHYQEESIALNDIGAGTYFGQIQLTDMVGIGDQEVFKIRQQDQYTADQIQELTEARQSRIAIVHDIWVGSVIPTTWLKMATYTIPDNVICADASMSFYACSTKEQEHLKQALVDFKQRIPKGTTLKLFFE